MEDSLTSRPPGLLNLPTELLLKIFDDVYLNWSEVEPSSSKSSRPLTSPLSRALVDYQRQGLYRNVTITIHKRSIRFFKSILAQPRLASLLVSLTLKIPGISGRSTSNGSEVSPDEIETCFSSFINLEALSIREYTAVHFPSLLSILTSDTLSSKCTSISLSLPRQQQDALVSLPLNVRRCNFEVVGWQTAPTGAKEDKVSRPPFSRLSTLTLSNLQDYDNRDDLWTKFLARCTKLRRLRFYNFDHQGASQIRILQSLDLQSITGLSFLNTPRYISHVNLDSILPKFSNLRQLCLSIECCDVNSDLFFTVIRRLPLEILIFTGEGSSSGWFQTYFPPLSSLEALVSPPNQHATLRTLKLDCIDQVGRIGTRISTIDLRFHSIDRNTETPVDDLFPDDWNVPNLPKGYSIEGLKALRLAGEKNGVRVHGDVLEAMEVREAYEEDAELLTECWEDWKEEKEKGKGKGKGKKGKGKKGKKGKKGGSGWV
ncbi:hypothetical protein JCM5350_002095 [Sporobolomyces pararoseus]